ncbi:globin domain-containing protein [Granulicella sp. dw_53]|uniref:globin domain-containing protein n=1 Tax=Granulicella sp. dw_53 TaxID=2719792 RepID=UPI001BD56FFF|nr:globin domain-containing protein [Granulicella sp. dw_53]
MLDNQTQIIKSTVPVLQKHGEEITRVFYQQMLAAHPELRTMFDPENQKDGSQARRLAGAILAYAANIDRLVQLNAPIDKIAHKHVGLHVLPEQYPIVGEHLLGAIKTVLGDGATPEVLDAWGAAYNQLADIMIAREKILYDEAHLTAAD